jgi:hypothetical protein
VIARDAALELDAQENHDIHKRRLGLSSEIADHPPGRELVPVKRDQLRSDARHHERHWSRPSHGAHYMLLRTSMLTF